MSLTVNTSKEYTLEAVSRVSSLKYGAQEHLDLIEVKVKNNTYLVAINKADKAAKHTFTYQNKAFTLNGRLGVYAMKNNQE